jgi:hypothetical protein
MDLKRKRSIFEMRPELKASVKDSVRSLPSHFGFVKSNCFWTLDRTAFTTASESPSHPNKIISIRLFMDFKTAKLLTTILK